MASNDSLVFAGTVGAGVYRSTDNGQTWIPSNAGMSSEYARCLAFSGSYLYAGAALGEGVSVSIDNGASWQTHSDGLPPNPWVSGATGSIDRLAASNRNVFVSMSLSPEAFYLSTNNGDSWFDANTAAFSSISAIAVLGDNFFIGDSDGVYCSTNSGATWLVAGLGGTIVNALSGSGQSLFAGTNNGVFLSSNSGASWSPVGPGLPESGVVQLSVHDSYVMAKVSDGRFFLSTNSGTSWFALSGAVLPDKCAVPNAFVSSGATLFYGFLSFGICRSVDNGKSWALSNTGLGETEIFSLSSTRHTVFVGALTIVCSSPQGSLDWTPVPGVNGPIATTDFAVYGFDSLGVCCSTDEGKNWTTPQNVGVPASFHYTALAVEGNNYYLGGAGICGLCDQGGVYLSTNSGASWRKSGLSNITLLTTHRATVYAVSVNSLLFASKDTAQTWDTISFAGTGIQPSINAMAFRDSEMFVGYMSYQRTSTSDFAGGVLRSTDEGRSWEQINLGLPGAGQWVLSLVVRGHYLFAGTTVGVYVLNDDNRGWTSINSGLPLPPDRVYYLAASDSDLYAGFSGSVWQRALSGIQTSLSDTPVREPSGFSLTQNYPNPFNPTTTIRYALPQRSHVTLTVFNALGQQAATLVNETEEAGNHDVRFDARSLASGVYFYRIVAGTFMATKKLLVLR